MNFTKPLMCAICCAVLVCFTENVKGQFHGEPPRLWSERYPEEMSRLNATTSTQLMHWRFHSSDMPHGELTSLDDSQWAQVTLDRPMPVEIFSVSGKVDSYDPQADAAMGWYRTVFTVPATVGGLDVSGARLKLVPRFTTDGQVFVNGGLVYQGDAVLLDPIVLTNNARPGESFSVAVKIPYHKPQSRLLGATVLVERDADVDPSFLMTQIQATEAVLAGFHDGGEIRQKQLDSAVHAIDFAALDHGDKKAFDRSIKTASSMLQPINAWLKQYTVHLIGNAHIDMAFRWPWTETVETVRDTFGSALQLMKEYPNFTYTQSSAQDFEWIHRKYPQMFDKIRARVHEGRFELVGGMWVEPDLNMPDGESLVRQLLVGKRFFRSAFGVDTTVGWNPDSFGYSWQVPQIYAKSGFDTFVTQKMAWSETTVFPFKLFWWQSPDGSKVLTYFPHSYNGTTDPVSLGNDIANYVPQTGVPAIMQLYGVGDHGGGPTRRELDIAERFARKEAIFPSMHFSTTRRFFDDVKSTVASGQLRLPTWNSEMYLENHRGSYTTQAEMKKQMRRNEELVEDAEKANSLAFVTAGMEYSNATFENIWRKILFNQFHDLMAGSIVSNDVVEALEDLHNAELGSRFQLTASLNALSVRADTTGPGIPFLIFNPLSWTRSGSVRITLPSSKKEETFDALNAGGQRLPLTVLERDTVAHTVTLEIELADAPSVGYEVIHIVPKRSNYRPVQLRIDGASFENQFLRVTFDPKTACITHLVLKSSGQDTVAPGGCGNLLQAFADHPPTKDAWEIDFSGESWDLKSPMEFRISRSGSEKVVAHAVHHFGKSVITQNITLRAGSHRLDVETHVDWHEEHILLKAGFPVNAMASHATFEIPFGSIERPTTRNTPAEKAQFEVPAQKWGDISNEKLGLSLLNDSKYGYDAKDNVIRLSLLRSPQTPEPDGSIADQGNHDFIYSFYPHEGSWRSADTMHEGFELNFPLIAQPVSLHNGDLPGKKSFLSLSAPNAVLTAMKKAEDRDAVVLRFYEYMGMKDNVTVTLPAPARQAYEDNLMEKIEKQISLHYGATQLTFPISPYEIKTIEIDFSAGTSK